VYCEGVEEEKKQNAGEDPQEQPYTNEEDNQIIEALKLGASTAQEICFETGIDYMKIMEWYGYEDNLKLAERLSRKPLWDAKKKVMASDADPKWLLTHHKDAKGDWSDRVEKTGAGGKDLIPVSEEKKKEIDKALDEMDD